jgi:hypothetical protein
MCFLILIKANVFLIITMASHVSVLWTMFLCFSGEGEFDENSL